MTKNRKLVKDQWLYGVNPVNEAIKGGREIRCIYISYSRHRKISGIKHEAEKLQIPVKIEGEDFFRKFPKGHQGIVARVLQKGYVEIDELLRIPSEKNEPAFFLILDCIEDPRNLGAILRTAEAGGVHGVILQSCRSAGLSPAVYKTSAGAVEYIPIAQVSNVKYAIDTLKREGIRVYGADMGGENTLWDMDLSSSVAIVLGSEGFGLRRTVKQRCDHLLRIPYKGRVTSLNVSVATGVLIFEILRQRREKE